MGQKLTYEDAVATWRALTDPSVPEDFGEGALLVTCEQIILEHSIGCHAQAAAVCAVLAHGTHGREAAARKVKAGGWMRLQRLANRGRT